MKMNIEEIEKELDLEIRRKTGEGHSNTTFLGTFEEEKVIIKISGEELKREVEALKIADEVGISVPEVLEFVEMDGKSILVEKLVDSSFPQREEWKDIEFCRGFLSSAAKMINRIHSAELMEKAKKTEYCKGNRDRAMRSMEEANSYISEEVGGEVSDICRQITSNVETDQSFTHGDLYTANILISNGEIRSLIDWAECGFTSRLRDIATFEASFIDEYIRFFHPSRTAEMRQEFRSEIGVTNSDKLELFRFHQNANILAHIRKGELNQEWKQVGSLDEIKSHREKILKEDLPEAKELISNYSSNE
jgi:aminoglycoside phosphotransferase (APT) family kinase protein